MPHYTNVNRHGLLLLVLAILADMLGRIRAVLEDIRYMERCAKYNDNKEEKYRTS